MLFDSVNRSIASLVRGHIACLVVDIDSDDHLSIIEFILGTEPLEVDSLLGISLVDEHL